jgi:hypothetical protein
VTAMELDVHEFAADTPNTFKDAVKHLQDYVNHTLSALVSRPWLPVLLPSQPEDRTAGDWPKTHRKVTPLIPGKASAWAPVAITAVVATGAATIGTHQYLLDSCTQT